MKKFFAEFKEFISRGNVLDMAIGVVIAGAFGKITTSLVNDIIMPFVSMLTGGVAFEDWKWVLKAAELDAEGVEIAAEVAVRYGQLIAVILDFLIIAFCIFCVVKAMNAAKKKMEKPAEPEPEAPPAEPEPSKEELLLAEIRDLLKNK